MTGFVKFKSLSTTQEATCNAITEAFQRSKLTQPEFVVAISSSSAVLIYLSVHTAQAIIQDAKLMKCKTFTLSQAKSLDWLELHDTLGGRFDNKGRDTQVAVLLNLLDQQFHRTKFYEDLALNLPTPDKPSILEHPQPQPDWITEGHASANSTFAQNTMEQGTSYINNSESPTHKTPSSPCPSISIQVKESDERQYARHNGRKSFSHNLTEGMEGAPESAAQNLDLRKETTIGPVTSGPVHGPLRVPSKHTSISSPSKFTKIPRQSVRTAIQPFKFVCATPSVLAESWPRRKGVGVGKGTASLPNANSTSDSLRHPALHPMPVSPAPASETLATGSHSASQHPRKRKRDVDDEPDILHRPNNRPQRVCVASEPAMTLNFSLRRSAGIRSGMASMATKRNSSSLTHTEHQHS